jgi:hypothetical protein
VRGLQSSAPPRQLALPVEGADPLAAVWESFGTEARERILRLLARAIARVLTDREDDL